MFVYGGDFLLLVVFKASHKDDIKNCQVDVCVVPRATVDQAICSARYALYRLVWRGWMRATAERSSQIAREMNGWYREFDWWSGRPTWGPRDPAQGIRGVDHPAGIVRMFDSRYGRWYWEDVHGNQVLDVVGVVAWDSIQCWT